MFCNRVVNIVVNLEILLTHPCLYLLSEPTVLKGFHASSAHVAHKSKAFNAQRFHLHFIEFSSQ
jgi:hypothetical protein